MLLASRPRAALASTVFVALSIVVGCDETNASSESDAGDTYDASPGDAQTCGLASLDISACGVVEGRPFYGFYDGCNWCNCSDGQDAGAAFCTTRACLVPDPFTPDKCQPVYYGTSGVSLPDEEAWVCDPDGKLFRSGCAPASAHPVAP